MTQRTPYWGDYDPSHIYEIDFIGLGDTIRVNFYDRDQYDNSGFFTLEIRQP